jgi:hypothetical protein
MARKEAAMRIMLIAAAAAALTAAPALAEDNQAGTPLTPGDAAGAWTLQAGGRNVCVVTLKAERSGAGYGVTAGPGCAQVLGGAPAAWATTADGMRFVDAGGHTQIAFNRWSNSLLVSHRESGVDVSLKRGAPEPDAGAGV